VDERTRVLRTLHTTRPATAGRVPALV
jgi:hypothetical protein